MMSGAFGTASSSRAERVRDHAAEHLVGPIVRQPHVMAWPADHAACEAVAGPFEGEAWPFGRMIGNVLPSHAARFLRAAPSAPVARRARCWLHREPAPLHVDEQLPLALGTLAHAHLETDELLLALGRRPNQHEHALGLLLHPGLQIDAVGPDVGIAACGEIARLPAGILVRPGRGQPGDDGRREVRGVTTQQGCQRVLEVAGRDTA